MLWCLALVCSMCIAGQLPASPPHISHHACAVRCSVHLFLRLAHACLAHAENICTRQSVMGSCQSDGAKSLSNGNNFEQMDARRQTCRGS